MNTTLKRLTTEEMIEAAGVFRESVVFALEKLTPAGQDEIRNFILEQQTSFLPQTLFFDKGVVEMSERIFGRNLLREFFWSLAFTFFGRWGGGAGGNVNGLVENLVDACSIGEPLISSDKSHTTFPTSYTDRLVQNSDVRSVIGANKWLVMLLMIHLVEESRLVSEVKKK